MKSDFARIEKIQQQTLSTKEADKGHKTTMVFPKELDKPKYYEGQNAFYPISRRTRKFNLFYIKKPTGPPPIEPVACGLGIHNDQLYGDEIEKPEI